MATPPQPPKKEVLKEKNTDVVRYGIKYTFKLEI